MTVRFCQGLNCCYVINKKEAMSQAGDLKGKPIYGSTSKVRYEAYTDEELDSEEFFWNQLKTIAHMKNMEYLYHFLNVKSKYIEKNSGM